MQKINYPIAQPYFPENEIEGIVSQVRSMLCGEAKLSMGENVTRFESIFAEYTGSKYAVATNSCSAALEIALRSIGIKEGDEVIVPAETFIATGSSVVRENAKIVFAEIDTETFCLSANDLEKKITKNTKAVIVVHMAGLITPDIHRIQDICRRRDICLIEDAAHAAGASLNGKKAGSFGNIGCFSFYPTKVMTTAEGGMLVTSSAEIYKVANGFRNRGLDMNAEKEIYTALGTNNRMTEFSAALGISQLKCLDNFVKERNGIAKIYSESLLALEKSGIARPLKCPKETMHSYWRYLVILNEKIDRDKLKNKMLERGITIDWAYDPPLHLQPVFKRVYGISEGHLPVTERAMKHFVCLPMYVGLKSDGAQFIADEFCKALKDLT